MREPDSITICEFGHSMVGGRCSECEAAKAALKNEDVNAWALRRLAKLARDEASKGQQSARRSPMDPLLASTPERREALEFYAQDCEAIASACWTRDLPREQRLFWVREKDGHAEIAEIDDRGQMTFVGEHEIYVFPGEGFERWSVPIPTPPAPE
jgi:hypothetical protein